MRLALSACVLLITACVGSHSSGALWSQQYGDQEKAHFALSDAQRRAATTQFALSLADESLAAESQRLDTALQICPGPTQALQASPGDKVRDGIRVQAGADAQRANKVAQLALTDWYLRRASATDDAHFCDLARSHPAPPAATNLLQGLAPATVTRGAPTAGGSTPEMPPLVTLSQYAMGSIETVSTAAPLPHYLAWVYGGTLLTDGNGRDSETAAAMVDAQAPAYPDWEPDALYAALRAARS
jgi:hypothetical protein